MTTAVVDASAAAKWFLEEDLASHAEGLLAAYQDRRAPRLILSELGNVFWKKIRNGLLDEKQAVTSLEALTSAYLTVVDDEPYAAEAQRLSVALDHPFYDCLYLAVAKSLGAPLITADKRLLAKAAQAREITVVDLASIPPAAEDAP